MFGPLMHPIKWLLAKSSGIFSTVSLTFDLTFDSILIRGQQGSIGAERGEVWRRQLSHLPRKKIIFVSKMISVCILMQFLTGRKH